MSHPLVSQIKEDFKNSQKILIALGDENRQSIILVLMEETCAGGVRVGEITAQTHLSRPAVSHHLKILKEAKLISMRKEGTKNFYYFDIQPEAKSVADLVTNIQSLMKLKKEHKYKSNNGGSKDE